MNSEDLNLLAMVCHAAIHYPNDYHDDLTLMARFEAIYNSITHELELRDLQP
jgi:hypothetical protein